MTCLKLVQPCGNHLLAVWPSKSRLQDQCTNAVSKRLASYKGVLLGPHPKRTFPLSQIHQLVVWLRRGAASMSSISRV
jgi:hypothetical protein